MGKRRLIHRRNRKVSEAVQVIVLVVCVTGGMAIATVHGAAVLMAILLTVCSFLCWGLGRSSKLGDGKLHFQITGLCSAVCAVLLVVAAAVNSGDPSSAESGTELGKYESTPSTIYMPVFGKDGFVVEEKRLLPQEAE